VEFEASSEDASNGYENPDDELVQNLLPAFDSVVVGGGDKHVHARMPHNSFYVLGVVVHD
jgi:hypothetical protein